MMRITATTKEVLVSGVMLSGVLVIVAIQRGCRSKVPAPISPIQL
jgi:hypothetical protein